MMFPLVRELADDGVPVTVTCRVLSLCRQQHYHWCHDPIGDAELAEAGPANAIFDAHRDDPEFGYRFLADEVRAAGFDVSDRVVWRICRDNRWWSAFGKPKRGKGSKPGTPAHDDLVRRCFTAAAPNEVWVTDITEHPTTEGKLYASTRTFRLEYKASTAQGHAERQARRPKPAKLATNERLRAYVQDRLSGRVRLSLRHLSAPQTKDVTPTPRGSPEPLVNIRRIA